VRKPAPVDHPIHDLLRERWSPRAYDDTPVERAVLLSLLEAARWAPSSFNEQPWRFVVADRHADAEAFARLLAALVESNQAWVRFAPVLGFSIAKLSFERTGKPNRHAWHDVGLAMGSLLVEATARGLAVHQMAGYDADKARAACGLPEGFEPVAAFTIGYSTDPASLEKLEERTRAREAAPRTRRLVREFAFAGWWGDAIE
jgi:nitroreductase